MVSTVNLSGTAIENTQMKVDLSSFQVSNVIGRRPSLIQYLVVFLPFWVAAHMIETMSGGTASVPLYHKRKAQEERLSTLRKRRWTFSQAQG
jgi:hypothetical protein